MVEGQSHGLDSSTKIFLRFVFVLLHFGKQFRIQSIGANKSEITDMICIMDD